MPTTLVLRFPWGRYHATPWGRHVNEGAVELPPSPWRLLRALYAVWRTRAPELSDDLVHPLLARLAEPPVFHVPRHTIAHTRHYYPDTVDGTDRTLDAFAVVGQDAELAAWWPFDLPPEQLAALQRLASSLPYFGRADSLCLGRVEPSWAPDDHEEWAPLDTADTVDADSHGTAVLGPELPLDMASLVARPVDVRRGGLIFPTGTRFVGYQRTRGVQPRRRPRHAVAAPPAYAVRFAALGSALPPRTEAVVYTDLLRQAALSQLGRLPGERAATLLGGRSADADGGRPRQDGHRHAHFLPLFGDRGLTGFVVWTPAGLPDDELKALANVTLLHDHQRRLTVRACGVGTAVDVAAELCGPTTVWESVTPFTPHRHAKRNRDWTVFLTDEVTHELARRDRPVPRSVQVLPGEWTAWRRYRPSARLRHDPHQGAANRPSAFLRLTFDEPVAGPLAIGHLSHFGLGLFRPVPAAFSGVQG